MRNIWHIIRGDARRICRSVVAIVVIMGLCIVPCLYAWFNIFSNWDPYGTDATSRIRVAAVSEDRGADIIGIELNVGDKMIKELEANTQIGWVFVDSREEALELVRSSDCYAALVVPKDFSKDIVSFLSLKFEHPQLMYYENGKKNAIAPKITAQARTSVQQQVNATFLQSLVSVAAEIVSVLEAGGMDVETTLQNLSDTIEELGEKLDGCNTTLNSLVNLANATQGLMYASGTLVGDISYSLGLTAQLVENVTGGVPSGGNNISGTINSIIANMQTVNGYLGQLYGQLSGVLSDPDSYNKFVAEALQPMQEQALAMQQQANEIADNCEAMGLDGLAWFARQLAGSMGAFSETIGGLGPVNPENQEQWNEARERLLAALEQLNTAREQLNSAIQVAGESIGVAVEDAFQSTVGSIANARQLLYLLHEKTASVSASLNGVGNTLGTLESGLLTTMRALNNARAELSELSDFVEALAHSEFLQQILTFLHEGSEAIDGHIASPIQVETEVMYPADGSYGSQMSPFYTMLAQWVGALFCAVLIKTPLRREDIPAGLTMPQHYLGRMALFLFVGVTQALITSLGDLFYVDIFCLHPGRFVLAAVVSGICFTLINYMLVFTLGAAGLAASVIIMVIQVAGAGGTYPVEVVPAIFQKLYPFMPFKFGMNAMREAVSGMYGTLYRDNILTLVAISLATIPAAFLIYKPGKWINDLLEQAKEKSSIMT